MTKQEFHDVATARARGAQGAVWNVKEVVYERMLMGDTQIDPVLVSYWNMLHEIEGQLECLVSEIHEGRHYGRELPDEYTMKRAAEYLDDFKAMAR